MKVYAMRDLNPLQFFRGTTVVADTPETAVQPGAAAEKKTMPRNASLLFDIELEESQARKDASVEGDDMQRRLQYLIDPWSQTEQQLMQQVRAVCQQAGGAEQPADADDLAEALLAMGHSVTVRTALGGGGGGECLRNLRHVFLSVRMQGAAEMYLVDPKFAEQFEIAHPSPRYAAVLAAVPAQYVGSEDRLVPLVELLCSEMALAFCATGDTLPPWRQAPSMLSKWRPRRSTDETRVATPFGSFGFALNAAAGAKAPARASPGPCFTVSACAGIPPVHPNPRRSSLSGSLAAPGKPDQASAAAKERCAANAATCRAQASRTAASLLASELGGVEQGRRIGLQKLRACGGPKTAAEDENDSPTSVLDQAEGQQQQQAAAAPARPTRWQLVGNLGKGDASVLLSSSARGIRQGLVSGGL